MAYDNDKSGSRSTFGLLFYLNTSKRKKSGNCPIMVRITVDGKSTAIGLRLECRPEEWVAKLGRTAGVNRVLDDINKKIDKQEETIVSLYKEMAYSEGYVTAETLRNALRRHDADKERNTLMQEYLCFLEERKKAVGITMKRGTYVHNLAAFSHLKAFLKSSYGSEDVPFSKVDYPMIEAFDRYLKVEKRMKPASVKINILPFSMTVQRAVHKGWIRQNPFTGYSYERGTSIRKWLSYGDVGKLMQVTLSNPMELFVRDMFIFSVFTGISFVDLTNLKQVNLERQADGSLWIVLDRQKTGTPSYIPLLPIPLQIIDRYKHSAFAGEGGKVFRVQSHRSLSTYLKRISDKACLDKNLTFHAARHTFATLCLTEGVPIETLSLILGHTSITTTQIYGKITRIKLDEDMSLLQERIKGKYSLADTGGNASGDVNEQTSIEP